MDRNDSGAGVSGWLNNIRIDDPLERQQAGLLQAMLLVVLGGAVVGLLINLGNSSNLMMTLLPYLIVVPCCGAAIALLRQGRFGVAVSLAVIGLLLAIGLPLALASTVNSNSLLSFALPITLAGLLTGRRGLLLSAGLSIAIVLASSVRLSMLAGDTTISGGTISLVGMVLSFTLLICVLSLFLDRFGIVLHNALRAEQARTHELEQLRAGLEQTVVERTTELQETIDQLRASQETINELGAPILPVLPGVLAVPLVGAMDSARAASLAESVLRAVEQQRARHVIFDITGVPVVDTQVAQVVLRTAAAVRLLGAEAMLAGIRAEVAQTMVALQVDTGMIGVFPNLQEAIAALLRRDESALGPVSIYSRMR